jgi:HlyD family secretion protein
MQGNWWSVWSRRSPAAAIVIVLASAVTACGVPGIPVNNNTLPPAEQTAKVTRGTIRTTIGASGVVAAAQDLTLSFPSGSTVKTVNVSVGQRVKAGDVLGTSDTTNLQLTLQQQEANVAAAQAKYDQTAAGATQKDIDVAQANVNAAQAGYQAAATINPKDIQVARANLDSAIASYNAIVQGTTTPQDIANAEANVRSAQAKLDALKAGSNKSDIISAQAKVQQAQTNLDKVKADSASAKEQARIKWEQSADATRSAQRAFDVANATYQQAVSTNADPSVTAGKGTPVPTITPLKLQSLKQAADAAYLTVQQAEKTQQSNQLAYQQAQQDEVNNIATAQQQLTDAQAALSKLLQGPTQQDITQAQAAVDQAKASLDKLKRGPTDTDLAKAQAAIDSARATLNDLLAGPKQTDLQKAQAQVDSAVATLRDLQAGAKPSDLETALAALKQAQAQRDLAQVNLDQATVKAPFAGVVTQVNVVPGQVTSGGGSTAASTTTATSTTAQFEVVDDSQLHIDVNVSESDAANVQPGQAALITLDSVPGAPQQGTVDRVNPVAVTTSNVTAFPVRIVFTTNNPAVKPGANATVQIVTRTAANVLVVPSRAVTNINGQPAVTVLFNNATFLVPIRTGITDGRNTEVQSGLQEGDTVVLPAAGAARPAGATGFGPPGG